MRKNKDGEFVFRLEFNESSQQFHMDNYSHEANTYGWKTIMNECSDYQFYLIESFVNRVPNDKLTVTYIKQCIKELGGFINNLSQYQLQINNGTTQTTIQRSTRI